MPDLFKPRQKRVPTYRRVDHLYELLLDIVEHLRNDGGITEGNARRWADELEQQSKALYRGTSPEHERK